MKQVFLKFSGKRFLSAAFLSASVLLTSFNGNAATYLSNIEILSGDKTSVQFTGSTDDALLFKVHINNEKGDNFTVTIKNDNGDVLFSKSFTDKNYQKQFKVLKDDQGSERYYFTISSGNKDLEQTYVVNATTRVIDDVEINKL